MSTGKEAFESACQIGVAKSYNYRQLSQVFHGIDVAIREIEISGGGNIVISGSQPDGAEEGQIGFFQGSDGNYYEYIWVDNSWRNVKTQNNDVTVGGSAPFITISGTTLNTQQDINHYINDKIENLIVDPSGQPIDLEPFATIEYVDAADDALAAQISGVQLEVSGIDLTPYATYTYVNAADDALSAQISGVQVEVSGLDVRVASGETIQENLVPRVSATETTQTELVTRVASGETTQQQIVGRLDLLETTRGADKIYEVESVTTELAVRNGELVFNNADAALVSFISLAPFDNNGNSSPLVNVGDIIDVEVGGTTNRYQAAQGTTDAQSILCIYLSGDSTYAVGQTITIYIYPQNSGNLATTEYVDEQNNAQDARSIKLDIGENITTSAFRLKSSNGNTLLSTANSGQLNIYNLADPTSDLHAVNRGYADTRYLRTTALDPYATEEYVDDAINAADHLSTDGGTLSGNLVLDGGGLYTDSIIKSTRNSGYAFQVRPDEGDATAYIHTNGNVKFGTGEFNNNVTIDGNLSFTNSGKINAVSSTALSGRACLELSSAADYPIAISSGSSYKKILSFYGFDSNEDDNRGEVAYINANGKAYFNKVYTNDEELATQTYVDNKFATATPSFRWERVANNTGAENLTAGQFFIADNGNIYFHPVSADGFDFNVNSTTTGITSAFKQMVTVHAEDGSPKYFITITGILFNNSTNKYMRLTMSFVHIDDTTVVGESYRLNIPGFTF